MNLSIPNRPGCEKFNAAARDWLQTEKPELVILSADWMIYEKKKTVAEIMQDKYALLTETIDSLRAAGVAVAVIGPSPMFPAPVPQIAAAEPDPEAQTTKASYSRKFDEFFRALAADGKIQYVPVYPVFCDHAQFCKYKDGKDLLFWDAGHLTTRGGSIVMERLRREIPLLAGAPPG
jgi:lysophospholipase L1-like esterase